MVEGSAQLNFNFPEHFLRCGDCVDSRVHHRIPTDGHTVAFR
jgi:hypothetical protein